MDGGAGFLPTGLAFDIASDRTLPPIQSAIPSPAFPSFGSTVGPHLSNIRLPEIRVQPSGGEAAHEARHMSKSSTSNSMRARHCCFLFATWSTVPLEIHAKIREIVQRLVCLKEGSRKSGLTLTVNPTYFIDKEGRGVWLILTSNTTYYNKWKEVSRLIASDSFQMIDQGDMADKKEAKHGFKHLTRLFGLDCIEIENLHANRVHCDRLPEVVLSLAAHWSAFIPVSLCNTLLFCMPHQGKERVKRRLDPSSPSTTALGEVELPPRPEAEKAAALESSDLCEKKDRGSRKTQKANRFQMVRSKGAEEHLAPRGSDQEGHGGAAAAYPLSQGSAQFLPSLVCSASAAVLPVLSTPSSAFPISAHGSLVVACFQLIASANPSAEASHLIGQMTQSITGADEVQGSGGKYASFVLGGAFFRAFQDVVWLQTVVMEVMQQDPYRIPIESLTAAGIVKHNMAWQTFRTANTPAYNALVGMLEGIIATLNEAFTHLGFALFDPISTSFFVAVHALGKFRTDRNSLLYHSVQSMVQVGQIPPFPAASRSFYEWPCRTCAASSMPHTCSPTLFGRGVSARNFRRISWPSSLSRRAARLRTSGRARPLRASRNSWRTRLRPTRSGLGASASRTW